MVKSLIKIARETWFFWVLFLGYGFIVGRYSEQGDVSWRLNFVLSLVFALLVAIWVVADAKRKQWPLSFGYPALTLLMWPIFAPLYLLQTRGVRAFWSLMNFAAAYYISTLIGVLIGMMTT